MKTITTFCLLITTSLISYNVLAVDAASTTVTTTNVAPVPAVQAQPSTSTTVTTTNTAPAVTVQPPASTTVTTTTAPAVASANPTADFFTALSQCQGGMYQELNLLNDSVGAQWLNQQIIGVDDQGFCQVLLTTPDGRILHCYFDPYDVAPLGDQHFLTGMIMAATDKESKEALDAEKQWSAIKDQNCGFSSR